VEAAFAGTHTHIWYLDRFVLALIAGGAIVTLAYGYVTRITMVVLPLMLIAGPQSEMWTMLGPQETYAVPMVLVGLALVRWRHQTSGLALLLAAGLVKESFVLLVPAILVWLAWRQGRAAWRTVGDCDCLADAWPVLHRERLVPGRIARLVCRRLRQRRSDGPNRGLAVRGSFRPRVSAPGLLLRR
jgi:hypothetical protein